MCTPLEYTLSQEELKQQQQAAAEAEEKERNEWTQVCVQVYVLRCALKNETKKTCAMQSLQELRCLMKSKFDSHDCPDTGVKIAFKLPDGSKNEYKFHSHSTVKVSV